MRAESGTADTPAFPMRGLILLPFFKNRLKNFIKQYTGSRGDDERYGTEDKDFYRVSGEELRGLSRGSDGYTQQNGDDVDERTTGRLGQTTGYATLFEKVTKEEHTQQRETDGTRKQVSSRPTMGKMIFSVCDTTRGGRMRIRRSFFVVSRRMMAAELPEPVPCRSRPIWRWHP